MVEGTSLAEKTEALLKAIPNKEVIVLANFKFEGLSG